ncbi:MAG TPA: DNA gyrase subunit A [Candidatus Paceibacterota bacterium]|nr:DNA gyrase subunit A [Verrucomicrobiota bacterium]HRY48768.1 DNA gyrase subunit A [Candidatus Paceibacterota bacterium]HRZ99858.1 DNA gyrase subunit A [Candidatus Paceibacterota bacterium]
MSENPNEPQAPAGASLFATGEKIVKMNVADEIKNSFLDYSMSVIISRALPDVRDGLKPSQRRILYTMHELGLLPGRKHFKCAKICGDTSGNYHPHGESVIYPTLVHMAQPWAMRERLVDGQGNFGSVEGDPPAAMRYTEARMTHLGSALMIDMDRDTVDFVPNYDERLTEPTVFPAAFPNLLVNGGTGIAVGMATNIPPHNLGEIIDGVCAQIDRPEITVAELMKHVKGPDFPTGCMLCGLDPIRQYFTTGRGSLKIRGRMGVEQLKNGREQIVVTEIPYNVNRAQLVERIAELVNEKTLPDISGIRDESDENTRVVIELKRDAIPKVVINNLYKHTQLETSFSVIMLGIDHGRPKVLGLKELIQCYIDHRREVILRRTRFELRKAEERAELLEGYLIALANLDDFIRIIRTSATREEARVKLLAYEFSRSAVEHFGILIRKEDRLTNGRYAFSEAQADAILDLRLYQLTGLEREKVRAEYAALLEKIKDLLDILAKESRVMAIIKQELLDIKARYANPRLTELVPDEGEIAIEDLIANEGVIITLTHNGLIKRTNVSSYRAQRRGGKGVIGMATRTESAVEGESADFIEHLFTASTHDFLLFFTNTGRVYAERVHEVPDMARAGKGRSIANLLELRADEKIAAMIRIVAKTGANNEDETWKQPGHIFFATRQGTVKKTAIEEFANIRKDGIIAIGIEPGDLLIDVKLTSGQDEVVLITREGMSIRFPEEDVRSMGRPAAGVRGISLESNDAVVALAVVQSDATLLVAGENGIGKRTDFSEYRSQSRAGKGIITMKTTDRTGAVVGALTVKDQDEIMLITVGGQMVRIGVKDIREAGRNTMGVKLIDLAENDTLSAIAPVISEEEDQEEADAAPATPPPT